MKLRMAMISIMWVLMAGAVLSLVSGCDYGRMREDEALRTYETDMPDMPPGSVPTTGGIDALLAADLENISNPLADNEKTVELGALRYGYFCSHCHGSEGRGYGTVGQSFAPLPTDLGSRYVQDQSDGLIFYRISAGFRRHPPMYYTVSVEDRWAIIRYLRQLETGGR